MTWETYKYGKYVTRIKGNDKKGTCTSFFTFWKGTDHEPWSYEGWSEIDIELVPSDKHGTYSTNIIWNSMKQDQWGYGDQYDPKDEWHNYEFHWTPDYISWYYDGEEIRRVTGGDAVNFLHTRE